jgi:hypothetical protein
MRYVERSGAGDSMIPNVQLRRAGVLPLQAGPVRFAVGPPSGLTSNSWKLWETAGKVYIACRDNFKATKVSLHGERWRMGFTAEAVAKNSRLLLCGEDRAWEVWNRPPALLPQTVIAFRLIFLSSELAVRPEDRTPKKWKDVIHIEAGPSGKLTALTLFVTTGDLVLKHESEPGFCLASLDIGSGQRAQLVAHAEAEGEWPSLIERAVADSRARADSAGVNIPAGAYGYFFGHGDDGSRFLVGARLDCTAKGAA